MPIITAFQQRHGLQDTPMVVAADAGMLSASNLKELDAAGLSFIVGSRTVKAPIDLASHFHCNGDNFADGQIIDTVTPRHGTTIVNDCSKRAEPVWGLFDFDRAISLKSGLRPAVCGCSGIVSGVPSCLGSGIRIRPA